MKLEVDTLVGQRTWESLPRTKGMNVLKSTWAFKLKRLPDGTAYRHKARFCARGDLQKEGIDFLRHTRQLCSGLRFDCCCPRYLPKDGRPDKSIIPTLSRRSTSRRKSMLNTLDSLDPRLEVTRCFVFARASMVYDKRHAPSLKSSRAVLKRERVETEHCRSVSVFEKGMICVVYVDDTIFATANPEDLDAEVKALGISTKEQQHSFSLRDEGEVSAFLGIQIKKTGPNAFFLDTNWIDP